MHFSNHLNTAPLDLYEPQLQLERQRMCGAAALVMAYRRCGLEVEQAVVWQSIAREYNGHFRAHSYLMARDALERGLVAVVLQSHRPWEILEACWRHDIAVILNHRLEADSHEGHYSLLAGMRGDRIRVQDPWLGPNVQYSRDEFLELWLPFGPNSEIAGNVLIAIAPALVQPPIWCHCNQLFEDALACPRCQTAIPLKPVVALGCWNERCSERLWWRLFCPNCDCPISQLPTSR
jgi:hypothetical protein